MDKHRLIQDDDGHWFVIPLRMRQEFDRWVSAMDVGDAWHGADFNEMRVSGPHAVAFSDWEKLR